jgi:hypothetical protein
MSKRLSLDVGDWPARDQQLWTEAQMPPGFLEAPKPASQWSPKRRRIVEQGAMAVLARAARSSGR